MHIPDGFLDPKITTGLIGIAVAVLSYSFSRVKASVTALVPAQALALAGQNAGNMVGGVRRVLTGEGTKTIYQMGMVAALVFAGQMFDFPVLNGGTGHLLGGLFAAVVLGPFAGMLVMSLVLIIQMLFFADGGMLAIGANIFNIAVIGSFGCYYIYSWLKRSVPEWLAIGVAAWLSVVLAAAAYSIEVMSPEMLKVHLLVGLAEALITISLVQLFRRVVLK